MSEVTRRDAVRMATTLALGAGGLAASALAEEPRKVSPADSALATMTTIPPHYMLAEHVVTTLPNGAGHNLVITSATNVDGKPQPVQVKSGKVAVFRAGPGTDEFTRKGGWTWTCNQSEGKTEFKRPSPFLSDEGPLVMVVRQTDDTVHWYSLVPDLRC